MMALDELHCHGDSEQALELVERQMAGGVVAT